MTAYRLPEFKGYTVDSRLRQFRKLIFGEACEFIPFDSPKGQTLLERMRREGFNAARKRIGGG